MNLPPFKLERYFAKYEFNTEFLLCSSDCEAMSIADLLAFEDGAADKFQNTWLGYTESQGSPALRKEICNLYTSMQPEHILVHTGAGEAIYLFMHAMLKEDDHVVVHSPSYQSLSQVAKGIGCQVSPWIAREENGWALDLNELRHLMRSSTKAVIINTPHNPTGYLMSRADYGEHAVSLSVTSKTYGLAGLRIGWIATKNKKVYENMASLKDYTTICNSAPSEFLAEVGIRQRSRLVQRNLGIIKENLKVVDDLFARHGNLFSWVRPAAGSMGYPRLLKGDVDDFCQNLVRRAGVLLLPGTLYADSGSHFRMGLGRKNLPQAVAKLEAFLKSG